MAIFKDSTGFDFGDAKDSFDLFASKSDRYPQNFGLDGPSYEMKPDRRAVEFLSQGGATSIVVTVKTPR
ncbi:hypothetical protein AB4Z25_28705 [Rhizobium sp. RAF36]|uniref:hypothetical protein n=1 Tax=Rhizobium sp. RAF36 TaxID=3233055 RepID=UPI003F946B73